jgi:hypothetical protein
MLTRADFLCIGAGRPDRRPSGYPPTFLIVGAFSLVSLPLWLLFAPFLAGRRVTGILLFNNITSHLYPDAILRGDELTLETACIDRYALA